MSEPIKLEVTQEVLIGLEQEVSNHLGKTEFLSGSYIMAMERHILEEVRKKAGKLLYKMHKERTQKAKLKLATVEVQVIEKRINPQSMEAQYLLLQAGSKL